MFRSLFGFSLQNTKSKLLDKLKLIFAFKSIRSLILNIELGAFSPVADRQRHK